jgi:PTS system mannose-specific IIA component
MEGRMINILVMSHGEFAEGICKSAEMIIGKQENLKSVVFNEGESLETLSDKLEKAIKDFNNNFPHLIFVDILGGTPSNVTALLLAKDYKINAVSGVNLPMLLEALTEREDTAPDILIKQLRKVGNESIIDIVEMFNAE